MLNEKKFIEILYRQLGIDLRKTKGNEEQRKAILAPINESLYIVAGPGSGKTTTMALKVLKMIFVDGVNPSNILVTTFTKKAATELRSRILEWGHIIETSIKNHQSSSHPIERLNLNQLIVGTLDSIIEEILTEYRPPGTQQPVIIEDFVSKGLMINILLKEGIYDSHYREKLEEYIKNISMSGNLFYKLTLRDIADTLLEIKDRIYHDQIDKNKLKKKIRHEGFLKALDAIEKYESLLKEKNIFDFALLEYARDEWI